MTGYIRQDVGNNIENDEIADATYLDQEFDAVQAAFNASTGHNHDGTTGEGGPITVIGPAQNYIASTDNLRPKVTDTYDLGTTTFKFKDIYISGSINVPFVTGSMRADFGAETTPSYSFAGDTDTGMWRSAANTLAFSTAGVTRVTVSPTGSFNVVGNITVGGNATVTGSITGDMSAVNITSGTLNASRLTGSYTGITGVGALTAGSIASTFGNINIGSSSVTAGVVITTGNITSGGSVYSQQNFISTTNNVVLANNGVGGVFIRPQGPSTSTGQTILSNAGNMTIGGTLTTSGAITAGGAITGSIAATNLTGTIASARLSGAYTGITSVGDLSDLTVNNLFLDGNTVALKTNTVAAQIIGGVDSTTGAITRLYGASHGSFPGMIINDAEEHRFRTFDGTVNLFRLSSADGLILGSNIGISFFGTGAATTRTNLGLGSVALLDAGTAGANIRNNTQNDARFLLLSNNLSDVANASTSRTNLGLGSMATKNEGTTSGDFRDNAASDARYHRKTIDTLAVGDLPISASADDWVQNRISGGGAGQLGTYALLRNNSATNKDFGETIAGSNLSRAYTSGHDGVAVSGTWQCMGWGAAGTITLWLRVS